MALNVAINSSNYSLLTILISNQTTELKNAVFKKTSVGALFQITCSDAKEWFQHGIFIFLVAVCFLLCIVELYFLRLLTCSADP